MSETTPKFLQIHTLTSYPASLLNRDDAGFAKRMPFGGVTRTRISSQCLKRHWRTSEGGHSLKEIGVPMAVRSRYTFDLHIRKPLIEDGVSDDVATAVTEALVAQVLGKSAKAQRVEKDEQTGDEHPTLRTGQVTVLGRAELDFLLEQAKLIAAEVTDPKKASAACKDHFKGEAKKNLAALQKAGCGLDAALFGRMVTADMLARGDAAVHVGHAFTVHPENSESDYFTAVDDLIREQEEDEALGSGHLGNTELTSGLFYGYVVVDVPLLVSNLEGCTAADWLTADRTLAARVVENLVHLVATVSPGAKLGSTAPYAYASAVALEWGCAQPCTWANAFLEPVPNNGRFEHAAAQAWAEYVAGIDAMYEPGNERCTAALPSLQDSLGKVLQEDKPRSLAEVADWAGKRIRGES